ncbi:uncharacterized protein LOC128824905 isoform X2 [Malaclemys terrapin pileata]|uniref:uncharacterized protein LOC128824905 isoform X2 n=1 Tax=Malaclemys terrapin pileata TaxID=2991368 RepID=UPI0023A797F4|nr:uncharacterized protein LOC128824905 isoform X2 [Malaclemys terrapin pileata]
MMASPPLCSLPPFIYLLHKAGTLCLSGFPPPPHWKSTRLKMDSSSGVMITCHCKTSLLTCQHTHIQEDLQFKTPESSTAGQHPQSAAGRGLGGAVGSSPCPSYGRSEKCQPLCTEQQCSAWARRAAVMAARCPRLLLLTGLVALSAPVLTLEIHNLNILKGPTHAIRNFHPKHLKADQGKGSLRHSRASDPQLPEAHAWPKDCSEITWNRVSGVFVIQPTGLHQYEVY